MNDSRRVRRLLSYAAGVARAFDAHLIGLHVFPAPRLKPPVPLPLGADVLASLKWSIDEEARHLKTVFSEISADERFVGEWRSVTAERVDPAKIVLTRARAADLLIASQADPQWDLSMLLDFPDRLAVESGRPVLVVPNERDVTALPKSVVIAWNESKEAARALFDALPLLKGAQHVEFVTVEGGSHHLNSREDILPASAAADALLRHGIRPTISTLKSNKSTAGEMICARASERKAELIVMGAYGHTRLREFVLGGATRHVLSHMCVPVLFSH
jgi:nucleotide-binding universal stress UspA family protein